MNTRQPREDHLRLPRCSSSGLTPQGSVVRGRRASLSFGRNHARPRIRCSRLLGREVRDRSRPGACETLSQVCAAMWRESLVRPPAARNRSDPTQGRRGERLPAAAAMLAQRPNWMLSGQNSGERADASPPFSAREHAAPR
jgi:hypothetical protein